MKKNLKRHKELEKIRKEKKLKDLIDDLRSALWQVESAFDELRKFAKM